MGYNLTEAEYAEVFGVALPENGEPEATGDVGETAEPESAEQQSAEPEEIEGQTTETGEQSAETGEGSREMPPEERTVWAQRRRNWEAKESEAVGRAAQARVDAVYAELFRGQTNPMTGKPITSEAEYRDYIAERDRQVQTEELRKAGIAPETLKNIVAREVEPLRRQMEMAKLAAMQEKVKAVNARMEAALKAELQKVTAMDPNVKTMEDIAAMPTAQEFNRYVQLGLGVEEAFLLANRQSVKERELAAAKAATETRMAGKRHLAPPETSGAKTIQVPRDVVEAYRTMMPDATDTEIQKAYASVYGK